MPSILTTLQSEIAANNNHSASITRFATLLPEIENLLGRRSLFYFSSEVGTDNSSMINDEDAYIIENLLNVPSDKKDLVLVLHSNGGYSISAERVIEVCRNYCQARGDDSKFYVLIPKRAKSAATIIALGADKIYLRDTAELGPVDPQFSIVDKDGNTQFIPAYLQVDAVENLLPIDQNLFSRISSFLFDGSQFFVSLPIEIKTKFFEQCNYPLYVNGKNELGLSDSIVEKIAFQKTTANREILLKDFDIFRDPHITKSHGRLINLYDLRENTLRTEGVINKAKDLFQTELEYTNFDALIWELYVRKRQLLNDAGNTIVKTVEIVAEDFYMSGKKIGQST